MTKFVKKHRSQLGRVSVVMLTIAGLVMAGGLTVMFVGTADALQLTNRSATLEDSEHSVANVDWTFVFTTATVLTTDGGIGDDFSIVLNFPTGTIQDPMVMPNFAAGDVTVTGATCDNTLGFTVQVVTESSNDGADGENDELVIEVTDDDDNAVDIPVGCVFTVVLGNGATAMDNPDDDPNTNDGAAACTDGAGAGDADVCVITIGTTNDVDGGASPTIVDSGDVLAAFISDVTVSVTVDESLTFSIDPVVSEVACETPFADYGAGRYITATSNAVDFGNISTFGAFFNACQDLAVVTNASNGYTVTAETDTSLQSSGGIEIDSGDCDAAACPDSGTSGLWTTPANYGFAYACDTDADDDAGSVCNFGTENTFYKPFACIGAGADCLPNSGETAEIIMSDTDTADDSVLIEYKLSIGPTQAAAVYSTQVTYVATPTF